MALDTKVSILNINDILPNRFQPRIKFGEEKINELAESIRKYGVIQPIIVRSIGDKYEIIAGERRYKASIMAGLREIPAIINNLDDKDSSEIALIENVQRENLTPIEEAISIKKILDMGGKTQEQIAEKLGMSQAGLANKLRLLNLEESVQEALLEKKISERHARSLLRISDTIKQKEMLNRIIKERMTVKKLDEEIQKMITKKVSPLEQKEIPSFLPKIEESKPVQKLTKEEQDVLDIINEFYEKKNKKEKENMNNNDPMNQFTIPNAVIENDVQTGTNMNMNQPIIEPINNPSIPQPQTAQVQNLVSNNEAINSQQIGIQPDTMFTTSLKQESINMPKEEMQNIPSQSEGRFFDVLPGREMVQENKQAELNNNINTTVNPLTDDSIFTKVEPVNQPVSQPVNNEVSSLDTFTSSIVPPLSGNITSNDEGEKEENSTISLSSIIDKNNLISRNEIYANNGNNVINESTIPTENIISAPPIPPVINEQIPTTTMPKEEPMTTVGTGTPLSFNMRQAINIARDTTSQIEGLGVKVDTEEMDLQDYYEIVIRLIKEK